MDQNFQTSDEKLSLIEAQIRECFGRVVWTHKTQEKCADIVTKQHKNLKIWLIVLNATTTTSLLIAIFGDTKIGVIIGAILSTLLFGLSMYLKDYDLGEITQKHISAANNLWKVRESYLSLLTDIKTGQLDIQEIMDKRDFLQKKLENIYSGAPRTFSKAYNTTSKALKKNQEYTFSDDEIDAFLPKELKKKQPSKKT